MTPHLTIAVALGFSAAFNGDYYKPVESIAPREPPIILEEEPWTMMQHIAEPAPLPLPSPSPSPSLVKTDSRFQTLATLVKTDSFSYGFQTLPMPIIHDLYNWLGSRFKNILFGIPEGAASSEREILWAAPNTETVHLAISIA